MSSGTITLAALAAAAAFALILIYALNPAAETAGGAATPSRPGRGTTEAPEPVTGGDAIAAVRFTDPSAGTDAPPVADDGPGEIRGSVLDARTGRPLVGAAVEVLDATTRNYVRGGEERGQGFHIRGLPAGDYVVQGALPAFRPACKDVVLTDASATATVSLELRPATLLPVRVLTPDGAPFAEAIRKARPNAANDLLACVTIEPLGAGTRPGGFVASLPYGAGRLHPASALKRLGNAPAPGVIGALELIEPPPAFASVLFEGRVAATREVGRDVPSLDFTIRVEDVTAREAAVRFRLVDGVTASTARDAWFIVDETTWLVERVRLDGEGHVVIPALASGAHRLRAGATDRAEADLTFDATAGGVTELGTIVLAPSVAIAGTVLRPDGRGARAQVRVFALDAGDAPIEERMPLMTLSDARGRFEIRNLVPRRYALAAEISEDVGLASELTGAQRHAAAAIVVDASGGSAAGVEIRLREAVETTITGGRPEAGTRAVAIRSPDGLPCWMQRGAPGSSTLLYLEPGSYAWEAEDELGRSHRLMFSVPAGPSAAITLPDGLR